MKGKRLAALILALMLLLAAAAAEGQWRLRPTRDGTPTVWGASTDAEEDAGDIGDADDPDDAREAGWLLYAASGSLRSEVARSGMHVDSRIDFELALREEGRFYTLQGRVSRTLENVSNFVSFRFRLDAGLMTMGLSGRLTLGYGSGVGGTQEIPLQTYDISCDANGMFTVRDGSGETLWQFDIANLPPLRDTTSTLKDFEPLLRCLKEAYAPLADKLGALGWDDSVIVNMREFFVPLTQALNDPRADMAVMLLDASLSELGSDMKEILEFLQEKLFVGTLRFENGDVPRITYYSQNNPDTSNVKLVADLLDDGLKMDIYTYDYEHYRCVGRVEASYEDALCVRVEDYENGGFIYLDAAVDNSGEGWSANARLTYDQSGYGDYTHMLLNATHMPYGDAAAHTKAVLRTVDGAYVTTHTLDIDHKFGK